MTRLELNEMLLERFGDEEEVANVVVFDTDAFFDAIIGIGEDDRLIYDYDLMILSLMRHDNMTREEAAEFIDYNTIRSLPYVKKAPHIKYSFKDMDYDLFAQMYSELGK